MRRVSELNQRWGLPPLSIRQAIRHVFDEIGEWLKSPSADEASDVLWCVGRLLLTLGIDTPFGTERLVAKIDPRFAIWLRERAATGCVCRVRSHCKCGVESTPAVALSTDEPTPERSLALIAMLVIFLIAVIGVSTALTELAR